MAGLVGRTEREVALDLEYAMRRRGAQAVSFPPIVAAAEHSALPHAEPRDVAIPADTLVTIDWGAHLDGYASDCTRIFATGELDPRDRAVFDLVTLAQETALAAVRPGPTGRELDAVARDDHRGGRARRALRPRPRPRRRPRGPRGPAPVAARAAMPRSRRATSSRVEPGVYVPGAVGVRIEDLVVVTDDGHEVLSGLSKELRTVA